MRELGVCISITLNNDAFHRLSTFKLEGIFLAIAYFPHHPTIRVRRLHYLVFADFSFL